MGFRCWWHKWLFCIPAQAIILPQSNVRLGVHYQETCSRYRPPFNGRAALNTSFCERSIFSTLFRSASKLSQSFNLYSHVTVPPRKLHVGRLFSKTPLGIRFEKFSTALAFGECAPRVSWDSSPLFHVLCAGSGV